MPVNKYFPKNIRKHYLIVCAYYTWRSIKTQVCQSVSNIYFYFGASCAEVIFIISLLANLSRSCILGNAQNERVAIIERWCSKGIGDVAPTSGFAKIVNLYRFTLLANLWKGKILLLIISDLGIISLPHLWTICPQAESTIIAFWTCAQLGYKLFSKYP